MKILSFFPFSEDQIKGLRKICEEHDTELYHVSSEEDAMPLMPEVEVVLGKCDAKMFAAAKQLKWIQGYSAGVDRYPFEDIRKTDVILTNQAGIYASQCSEHAWALLLALSRGMHKFIRRQDRKEWTTFTPFIMTLNVEGARVSELHGGTLGIVGMGGFGREMAKRALGYEMTVIAVDPVVTEKPDYVHELKPFSKDNLHDLLRRSDAVMLACPRTEETYRMIDLEALRCMQSDAYFINVTRGGIVDEEALATVLRNEEIAGAGLDVYEQEPLPAGSPLWELPNLIMTTHVAGSSQHRPRIMYEEFCANLKRYLKGEPLKNVVRKDLGF